MWEKFIEDERKKDYFKKLEYFIKEERKTKNIYPQPDDVFNCFKLTPLEEIKVVIIGQDPYHNKNQAHGLAFSTLDNKTPKSLINIKKEIYNDLNITCSSNNNLTSWAKQGVFLLNTILTVEENKPLSHQNKGWEIFTLNAFKKITSLNRPICFLLWGKKASEYQKYITNPNHLVLVTSHPSPFSAHRGFLGSNHFSKTNNYLIKHNILPIDFKI